MKNKSKIVFFGAFPPPYGGVTIKNIVLKTFFSEQYKTVVLKPRVAQIIILYMKYLFGTKIVLSISVSSLIKMTKIMRVLNPSNLNNLTAFIPGGSISAITNHSKNIKLLSKLNQLIVQSERLEEQLKEVEIQNVTTIPNLRLSHGYKPDFQSNPNIKCIFMSRVDPTKGINIVLEAFNQLDKNYTLDIFGPISSTYNNEFEDHLKKTNDNISYKGIFKKQGSELFKLLNKYDFLLLPTTYSGEGIPGIIIEAKFSGLPSIVSNFRFNKELIDHGIDGFLLNSITSEALITNLTNISREDLIKLKKNAYNSSNIYKIDNYQHLLDKIIMGTSK